MADDINLKSRPSSQTKIPATAGRQRDTAARTAGVFLLLTALATLAAVVGRVAADADQATLTESLVAISHAKGLYGIGGGARFLSGITLIVAAWFLLTTWIIRLRLGTPVVPILFAVSGLFTAVSGGCAIWLAATVPDATDAISTFAQSSLTEQVANIRWLTGKVGFAVAGLALIVAAHYQWKVGGTLRRIAPLSAIIGIAMQFIWIDSATFLHPINGTAFFLWLVVIGTMLTMGRVERHFSAMFDSRTESNAPFGA